MNEIEQSQETAEPKAGLSRPDFFTRVAGSHVSRRDMVKASVMAGGLVWSAPMLLGSSQAHAQETCCGDGFSTVTVTIAPNGDITCGTPTCLGGPACDAEDTIPCIEDFVTVNNLMVNLNLPILGNVNVSVLGITLQGATLAAIATETEGGLLTPDGCTSIRGCPDLTIAATVLPIVIQPALVSDIVVITSNLTLPFLGRVFGQLDHIELELCIPGTASGLCG